MIDNFFDILSIIITVGLTITGFREGFVRGIVRLVGFIILIVGLVVFAAPLTTLALTIPHIPPRVSIPLVFLTTFVLGIAAFHLISIGIHALVHLTPLGWIDAGLGATFGVIKSLLFCGFIATILSFAPRGGFFAGQYERSILAQPLAELLSHSLPPVKKTVEMFYKRLVPQHEEPPSDQYHGNPNRNII